MNGEKNPNCEFGLKKMEIYTITGVNMHNYFTPTDFNVKTEIPRITTKVREFDINLFDQPSWHSLAESWKEILEEEKSLKERKEKIRDQILSLSKGEERAKDGLILRKRKRKGSVDYSKVPELAAVDLDPYRRKESVYWSIEVVKMEGENGN